MLPGVDMRKLEAGVHAVSGTPGRVFDMIKRRSFRTREIKLLVLDEADEMLNQGFKEQIYDIYRYLPPETQASLRIHHLEAACLRPCFKTLHSGYTIRSMFRLGLHYWNLGTDHRAYGPTGGPCVGYAACGGAGHDQQIHEPASQGHGQAR